jgi:3-(3-hydroxy-phenyl)propionate hydroxylase
VLRTVTRLPGADRAGQRRIWIPDARYADGFFAAAHPAVSWQIPQPTVGGVPLDDLVGGRWVLLHTGSVPPGAGAWSDIGVRSLYVTEPSLARWLRRRSADAVVLRPDGFIYAATSSGKPIPAPPVGLDVTTLAGAHA